MNSESARQLAQKIIDKHKWWDMLSRFIDVLRINVFVIDVEGHVILPPDERKYGGRLLSDRSLGFDLSLQSPQLLQKFEPQGQFLEALNHYDLRSFAIPIVAENNQTIAYMIVGPVILNKRLEKITYLKMAKDNGSSGEAVWEEITELRVVSHVMINSILDLLSEIIRDNIDLTIKGKQLDQIKVGQEPILKDFTDAAKEIYSTVHIDELLATLLDVALKITKTECGSIMVIDDKKGDLTIKVSRGLQLEKYENIRIKIGEGVSGIAFQENRAFMIKGQEGDNRIKHLLNREDIKHSLVMPLLAKNRVFGVLNLHTKSEEDAIEDNLDNLKHLSKLLSSAI